jgi:hypothetical protein
MKKWIGISVVAFALATGCASADTGEGPQTESPMSQIDETQHADLSQAIQDNYGETSWGMTVTDVEVENGMATVRAQIPAGDQETATQIQRGVINLVRGGDFGDILFVIVKDGTGTVVTQEQV